MGELSAPLGASHSTPRPPCGASRSTPRPSSLSHLHEPPPGGARYPVKPGQRKGLSDRRQVFNLIKAQARNIHYWQSAISKNVPSECEHKHAASRSFALGSCNISGAFYFWSLKLCAAKMCLSKKWCQTPRETKHGPKQTETGENDPPSGTIVGPVHPLKATHYDTARAGSPRVWPGGQCGSNTLPVPTLVVREGFKALPASLYRASRTSPGTVSTSPAAPPRNAWGDTRRDILNHQQES